MIEREDSYIAGTKIGGQKAREKNLASDPDFYKKIGSIGGKNGNTCDILSVMSKAKDIQQNPTYKVLDSGVILSKLGIPMKPQLDAKGYLRVQIKIPQKENGVTTLKVHRAVAEAFLDNPQDLPQVDHKDGDKSNNDVSNLEWVTNSENQRRAVERGAYDHRLPENISSIGGQVLSAILKGYIASDIFELNDISRKTFWKAVSDSRVVQEPIQTIKLGRKKKYYYFDKTRGKWRVERSDYIATGRQFDTESQAAIYAKEHLIGGGFAANPELARIAGMKGGRISRRKPKQVA